LIGFLQNIAKKVAPIWGQMRNASVAREHGGYLEGALVKAHWKVLMKHFHCCRYLG